MNYLKTKTIQRQSTIIEGAIFGVLLLFLLNFGQCGNHNDVDPVHTHSGSSKSGHDPKHAAAIKTFKESLGSCGDCKPEDLLKQIREDAEKSGNTEKINGIVSYTMPTCDPDDSKKKYFEKLLGESLCSGICKQVVEISSKSKKTFNKGTGIYVTLLYMRFIERTEEIVGTTHNKQQINEKLEQEFANLKKGLAEVVRTKGNKGIVILIPVEPNTVEVTEASDAEKAANVYFVKRDKAKMTDKKKNYTLTEGKEKKFAEINNNIEEMINTLVSSL